MATQHFNRKPFGRAFFNIAPEEVKDKFSGWAKNANYNVRVQIVLQIDTTNVSPQEIAAAPKIQTISTNQAILQVFRLVNYKSVSFEEFNNKYASWEAALEKYVQQLLATLNSTRAKVGLPGQWYINYGLNDREISVSKA